VKLVTERLILRPMTPLDAGDLLEYQSNSEIVRYIPWPLGNEETVRQHIEKTLKLSTFDLNADGKYFVLVWEMKDGGKVIGQSNLGVKSLEDKCGVVGWVTHQDYQGKGYAFEASSAILEYAFKVSNFHRVVAEIDTRALNSAMLAKKLGMRLEGEFRQSEFLKGEWCDMWLYAMLKEEFMEKKLSRETKRN
jgi:RimJ/RimL family protein N-acetyltransferase